MPRYKLIVEYDGTPYVGWQTQKNGLSVEEVMEAASSCAHRRGHRSARRGPHRHRCSCAGPSRARRFVPHVARGCVARGAERAYAAEPHCHSLAQEVPDTFDARFSAIRRHYLYRIVNRRAPLTVEAGRAWHLKRKIDASAMQMRRSFCWASMTFRPSAIRNARPQALCERSSVSTCRNMARNSVSSKRAVFPAPSGALHGRLARKCRLRQMARERHEGRADACDRRRCGPVAPPEGLYLTQVDYGETHAEDDDGE